jgi:hypothetical protein
MKWISAQDGKLVHLQEQTAQAGSKPSVSTGLAGLDALLPTEGFRRGAVHELLHQPHHPQPRFVAAMLTHCPSSRAAECRAKGTSSESRIASGKLSHLRLVSPAQASDCESFEVRPCPLPQGEGDNQSALQNISAISSSRDACIALAAKPRSVPAREDSMLRIERDAGAPATANSQLLIWFDPDHTLYPPALAAMGIDLARLYLVRPKDYAEHLWALAECLRCPAVGAVVASVDRLSRTDARKLQLAAEQGGGIALLLRPFNKNAHIYAAATRWLIEPAPGERNVQRWRIQLLHGHGGRDRSFVYLEHDRETHLLRTTDQLADRSTESQAPPRVASA